MDSPNSPKTEKPLGPIKLKAKGRLIPKPPPKATTEEEASKENALGTKLVETHDHNLFADFLLEVVGLNIIYEVTSSSLDEKVEEFVKLIERVLEHKYIVVQLRKFDHFVFLTPARQLREYYQGYPTGKQPSDNFVNHILVYVDRQ